MTPKTYRVLQEAIERGVAYGWMRAHKYTEQPERRDAEDAIYQAVMHELCEWFDLDDPPEPLT